MRVEEEEEEEEEQQQRYDMSVHVLIDAERCTGGTKVAAGMPPSRVKT